MKVHVHRAPLVSVDPFDLSPIKNAVRIELDETEFDDELTSAARAAAAEVEHFAQLALLNQTVTVTIFDPICAAGQSLPIGPVDSEDAPTVTIDGSAFTGFDFVAGPRPYLHWQSSYFDLTPCKIVIVYQAGFGETADDVPADLAEALADQAALHFDGRSPMDSRALTTSPHMARICARYRGVQA